MLRSFLVSLLVVACGGPSPAPRTEAAPKPAASTEASPKPVAEAPKEEPTPSKTEPEAPKPVEATAPTVKVIDAGAAPRKALRYRFKVGAIEYVEMDMKLAMAMSMGGRGAPKTQLPTVRMTIKIQSKELTPEGDLRFAFDADKVELLKDAPIDPKLRGTLESDLAGVVGMHGTARISARGVASESSFELPPSAKPQLKSHMDNMRDAIRQMYVPFPEEEVGKGAKWEVTSRVPLSGALMDTKLVYTLTSVGADGATANVDTTLSAEPNQPMHVATLPPGATATLASLSGKGNGKVAPSFVKLTSTATNKLSMESAFDVAMGGDKVQMTMQSDMSMAARPAKAPAVAAKKP